jgi:hypothetical protein
MDLSVKLFDGSSKKLGKQVGYNKYKVSDSEIVMLVEKLEKEGDAYLPLQDNGNEYPVIKIVENLFQTPSKPYAYVLDEEGKVKFLDNGVSVYGDPDFPAGTETHEITPEDSNVTSNDPIILKGTVTKKLSVDAPSIKLDAVELEADKRVVIKGDDLVKLEDVTTDGQFKKQNGNTVISIEEGKKIVIENMSFGDDFSGYNAIEIGLNGTENLPEEIIIENCKFKGTLSNNAISIFGTADNATITIKNCEFDKVSNIVRLSNKTNATGVKVIVEGGKCSIWEQGEYAGMFIMQDYTSANAEAVATNNLFNSEKLSIEINNFEGPNGMIEPAEKLSDIMCSHNNTQLAYVYADKGGNLAYNPDIVPGFSINGQEIVRDEVVVEQPIEESDNESTE